MMRKLSIALTGLSVMILGLTACNSQKKSVKDVAGQVAVATPAQTNAAVHKIFYGEWIAYKVGNQLVDGSDRPYVIFDGENTAHTPNYIKMYGNDGCNIINGTFTITPGGKMQRASELISTMRLCPDAPYEMGINLAFNNVERYELDKIGNDYLLNLKGANDSTLIVLRKYDLNFINGAWAVTHINGQKVTAESEPQLVFDTPEQKIHGNVGCNTMNGKIVINPDRQNAMSFTDMLTTRMTCPDIATEQALLLALDKVVSVFPINDMAGAQLKDEAGNTVVTLKRIQLR
ncbi:MAG: META domain-containing protein [Firmicutes bacterium]|nr:META domain-containing protein [Bacillota bacterium]MCM1400819.1 META domain-containing protein [Bacteroides sp.]MCM1476692.1 META domain-containing protein [Bacteroides sp.]